MKKESITLLAEDEDAFEAFEYLRTHGFTPDDYKTAYYAILNETDKTQRTCTDEDLKIWP